MVLDVANALPPDDTFVRVMENTAVCQLALVHSGMSANCSPERELLRFTKVFTSRAL